MDLDKSIDRSVIDSGSNKRTEGDNTIYRALPPLPVYGTSTNIVIELPPCMVTVVVYRPDANPALN